MSATGLKAFDSTLHLTNTWLSELMEELGWSHRERAYHALRVVLHALRDRLPIDEVAALGAQVPLLVRGIYYEGWHPAGKPLKGHRRDEFLAEIEAGFPDHRDVEPETVARAVVRLLERHVSPGQIQGVKNHLPGELGSLWP